MCHDVYLVSGCAYPYNAETPILRGECKMKNQGIHYLLAFLSFVIAIGIACSGGSASPTQPPPPTAVPVQPTAVPVQPTVAAPPTETTPSGSDVLTFTDQNKYYQIDLPADWNPTTGTDTNVYWDTFRSPDKHAAVENVAYDDGTPWSGKDSGKAGLYLLNHTYSSTGSEGDIHVTEEKRQSDGSDRLLWYSQGGKYSGISFFEIRGSTTFLMFTVWWDNPYKDQYIDTLNKVIESYRVP